MAANLPLRNPFFQDDFEGRKTRPITKVWVDFFKDLAARVLPGGGKKGQVLAKASDKDYDVAWTDAVEPGSGSGTVTNTGGDLTNNMPVLGAGGADAKVGTKSGTTNELATVSGGLTPGNFLTVDSNGNIVDSGSSSGGGGGAVTSVAGRTGAVVLGQSDITGLVSALAAKAPLASPALTGNPTAPTPTAGDNDTSIATTAFVHTAVAAIVEPADEAGASHEFLTGYNATTGAFSKAQPTEADVSGLTADLATITGDISTLNSEVADRVTHTGGALTADLPVFGAGGADVKVGTKSGNTDEVATVSGSLTPGNFLTADADGNVVDGGFAPGAGGGGGGTVTHTGGALTADLPVFGAGGADVKVGTKSGNTDEVATVSGSLTAGHFVTADGSGNLVDGGAAPVTSVAGHTGAVTLAESDITGLVADLALKAPLASPALTGTPTAPTAAAGTNTTQIATTAFVEGELGPGGTGAYFAWGGDGSDGAVTFDGAATILGMAPSGGVYTLTRDVCCTDITVNSGVTIKTANYAIFATGTVTVNGTIHNDGQSGGGGVSPVSSTGGNGGLVGLRTSAGSDGHYPRLISPVAGGAGGNGGSTTGAQAGAANAGNSVATTPLDSSGVAGATGSSGGKGGTGTSGAGGAARTGAAAGTPFAATNLQTGRQPSVAVSGVAWNNSSSTGTAHPVWASNAANGGAAGGSGGGGDGTNSGGGGGGGGGEGGSGGVVAIFAHTIAVGATGIIRSNGGAGGNGGNGRTPTTGNCGGGGGGAGGSGGVGGIVWLIYHRYTNAGTVQANGGAGGTGGTKGSPSGTGTDDAANGSNGSTGPAGNVVTIPC